MALKVPPWDPLIAVVVCVSGLVQHLHELFLASDGPARHASGKYLGLESPPD